MKSNIYCLWQVALTLGLVAMWSDALGCSCGDRSLQRTIDGVRHIFVAELTSVSMNPDADIVLERVVAEFEAIETIKGSPQELDALYSGVGGGDCGFPFLVGTRTLIMTTDGTVSICGATQWLSWFEDEREYIDLLKAYVNDNTVFDFEQYRPIASMAVLCRE